MSPSRNRVVWSIVLLVGASFLLGLFLATAVYKPAPSDQLLRLLDFLLVPLFLMAIVGNALRIVHEVP